MSFMKKNSSKLFSFIIIYLIGLILEKLSKKTNNKVLKEATGRFNSLSGMISSFLHRK